MSATQILHKTEMWQPEPQKNLVESISVEKGEKLSINKETLESIQGYSWEDLRGLTFVFDEE